MIYRFLFLIMIFKVNSYFAAESPTLQPLVKNPFTKEKLSFWDAFFSSASPVDDVESRREAYAQANIFIVFPAKSETVRTQLQSLLPKSRVCFPEIQEIGTVDVLLQSFDKQMSQAFEQGTQAAVRDIEDDLDFQQRLKVTIKRLQPSVQATIEVRDPYHGEGQGTCLDDIKKLRETNRLLEAKNRRYFVENNNLKSQLPASQDCSQHNFHQLQKKEKTIEQLAKEVASLRRQILQLSSCPDFADGDLPPFYRAKHRHSFTKEDQDSGGKSEKQSQMVFNAAVAARLAEKSLEKDEGAQSLKEKEVKFISV